MFRFCDWTLDSYPQNQYRTFPDCSLLVSTGGGQMLTRKQQQLLLFIDQRLKADGVSPSFEEMKEALGLRSKSGVHRLITALVEREFIRRLPNRARALEVLRLPEDSSPSKMRPAIISERSDVSIGGNVVRMMPRRSAAANDMVEIPLHGRIAAGMPIEALERADSMISLPPSMIGSGDHFALEIDGDSMVDAGILDGDTVIIQKCEQARDGEIVVALIDASEATLKEYRKQDRMIRLEPRNASHKPQLLDAARVQVQGRLVGLLRRY
jgi:repressor LexA